MKNDFRHNASGALDLTAYEAIQRADKQPRKQTCPRCEFGGIEPDHNFCMICGLPVRRREV